MAKKEPPPEPHDRLEESRYSFNRIWALFAEAKSANRTIKDDRIRYSLHIAPALGKKSIPELTVHDIDRLRSRLEKAGKSPQTVKHVLTLIKRLLNFALRKGYVEAIPGTLHISMPTVDNKVTENLTPEQARKLLQALDEEPDQNAGFAGSSGTVYRYATRSPSQSAMAGCGF